ncbi:MULTISPECIES: phage terminase large subunit family protein, partial [unclassified Photorhabdus]
MITIEEKANTSAWQNFTQELYKRRPDIRPPEPLSLSVWANKYAVLSKETSAQTGRFRSFAYQDGMMDAITDPTVTYVSVMKSARVGYTKILDHVVGYYLAHDPSPILVVQPRVEDAEDYSKTEIAPMLRDTPVLAEISGDPKAKNSNQTILKKTFLNGSNLTLVGANSPGGFRRITCRIILFDEVDGYPSGGAGVEGDQIALGTKRSETFWNRKIVLGSTPTVKGASRIEKSFGDS